VIEDEHDIARFVRAYFRASGQEVVHVDPTSAAEVAAAVAEHRPACILLDLNLRGFHGLEAVAQIRTSAGPSVPVIVVTADHAPATRRQVEKAGVDAFVTKPFKIKELCELVRDHVAARPDEATGLPGVAFLHDRLVEGIATGAPVCLALVRVAGAKALGEAAEALASALGDAVLVRSADDELAVILSGTTPERAAAQLEAALDAQAGHRAGVAACPGHASDGDELYMAADAALADACDRGVVVAVAV
jgi:CheY-like chemotaxis protein